MSERVVVLSPHLDDAVFSLGATMAHLAASGVLVDVLTVFGGDPDSQEPSGQSNRRAGFATRGDAAAQRRREDAAACARLGVRPRWLSFDDDDEAEREPAAIAAEVQGAASSPSTFLVPAWPLAHPDHRLVAEVAAECLAAQLVVGYVEQPYATWERWSRQSRIATARRSPPWRGWPGRECVRCRALKWRAMRAYASQLPLLRQFPRARVFGYELLAGGELLAAPPSAWVPSGTRISGKPSALLSP